MAVPTMLDPSGPALAGDLAIWKLPPDAPQPYPGATLRADGVDQDTGQPARAWTATVTHPANSLLPQPWMLLRGYVGVDEEWTPGTEPFVTLGTTRPTAETDL